jgi:hypothetical protein
MRKDDITTTFAVTFLPPMKLLKERKEGKGFKRKTRNGLERTTGTGNREKKEKGIREKHRK